MTATEKLRAMLDERGVEWCDHGYENHVWWGDWHAENRHSVNGLYVKVEAVITTEQAITATLGAGTCHEVMIDKFFRGCSECGYMWEYMYGIGNRSGPNFCPNCGRKVVGE